MPNLDLGDGGPGYSPPAPGGNTALYSWYRPFTEGTKTIGIAAWTKISATNWGSVDIPSSLDGENFIAHIHLPLLATSSAPILSFDLYIGGSTVFPALPILYAFGRNTFINGDYKAVDIATPVFTLAEGTHNVNVYWQNTGTGGVSMLHTTDDQPYLTLMTAGRTYAAP